MMESALSWSHDMNNLKNADIIYRLENKTLVRCDINDIKNVIRKENFWKYVLVFFVSLFLNFSLIILLSYFQEKEYQRINTLENRSLVTNATCDELKKIIFIVKIMY